MKKAQYPLYQSLNMPAIEQDIQKFWDEFNIFEQSVTLREGAENFVFFEGPPSANGLPGIHHVISRTLKDMVCRYKTMQGFQVKRKAGWDTHGLPVELGVEKKLGITKADIGTKITVQEYNDTCKKEVMQYTHIWDDLTKKMGYWVDLENPYVTYETNYVETLWWCLKELYNKGYLYQSVSIQPYSPAAGTGLSSHELNQPGTYRDVKDTSCTAMFKLDDNKNIQHDSYNTLKNAANHKDIFFMAWTTTPWTLPSNVGLTVGQGIEYSLIQTINPYTNQENIIVLATKLIDKYLQQQNLNADFSDYKQDGKNIPWVVLHTFKGKDLEGLYYEQLLPYIQPEEGDPFRIVIGDFVTTNDGTGIVHTSPAFGSDDFKVGQKNNLGMLLLVDKEGKFTDNVGEFSGRYVKNYKNDPDYIDVNIDICVKLKKENRAFKVEKYAHNYPHCWRTDMPIIYYPLDAWFIKTTAVKDRLIQLNKTINWKPQSTGEGRFGNWLENMVDWNLSRSRYWGTPLPIWTNEDKSEIICIGSIEELTQEYLKAKDKGLNQNLNLELVNGKLNIDLHKPNVDDLQLISESGQVLKRVDDLIDVWFDSGAMPYAQWHYPFENKDAFKKSFPADFIAEGVDQTRGWFYTLHVLGTMLFDSVAYKTVISNGLVLDKNGEKMSKRKGNVVDPFETIAKYSADATRWYLLTNASPWESNKFDIDGISEVQKKFFGTFYNTYQFFAMYANVDGFRFEENYIPINQRTEIDRWIISILNSTLNKVQNLLNQYEPTQAFRLLEYFMDVQLSNWYVRLCRRRFWKGAYEIDKIAAYQTLYECLETLTHMIAPLSPFFADWMFKNLTCVTQRKKEISIHLEKYPSINQEVIDLDLEEKMSLAMDATSIILGIRKKEKIKVRQPLQKILIPVLNNKQKEQFLAIKELILKEVNVKEMELINEDTGIFDKKTKANFKTLGAKMGPNMKEVANLILNLEQSQIQEIEQKNSLKLILSNQNEVEISKEDVEISVAQISGWSVQNDGKLTLALDITITEELENEGFAREFVNKVQNLRKEQNLEITDKIHILLENNMEVKNKIDKFKSYICAEILATDIEFKVDFQHNSILEVNEFKIKIEVTKI